MRHVFLLCRFQCLNLNEFVVHSNRFICLVLIHQPLIISLPYTEVSGEIEKGFKSYKKRVHQKRIQKLAGEQERWERLLETSRKDRQTCRKELRLDLNPGCCGKDTAILALPGDLLGRSAPGCVLTFFCHISISTMSSSLNC